MVIDLFDGGCYFEGLEEYKIYPGFLGWAWLWFFERRSFVLEKGLELLKKIQAFLKQKNV